MGEKRMRNTIDLWSSVLTHLEEAALNPEQRSAALTTRRGGERSCYRCDGHRLTTTACGRRGA